MFHCIISAKCIVQLLLLSLGIDIVKIILKNNNFNYPVCTSPFQLSVNASLGDESMTPAI
jgi:hypothetical protein